MLWCVDVLPERAESVRPEVIAFNAGWFPELAAEGQPCRPTGGGPVCQAALSVTHLCSGAPSVPPRSPGDQNLTTEHPLLPLGGICNINFS